MTTNPKKVAAVLQAATDLLKANNTVTTLEIKVKLIGDPATSEYYWSQKVVSALMNDFEQQGKFTFVDTGTYRVYSGTPSVTKRGRGRSKNPVMTGQTQATSTPSIPIVVPTTPVKRGVGRPKKSVSPTGVTQTVAAPVAQPAAKVGKVKAIKGKGYTYISHKKALDLMKDHKGRFFTAVFVDKKGDERTINCSYLKNQTESQLGYIKVKELSKVKAGEQSIRSVNIQTLKELKIGGVQYKTR